MFNELIDDVTRNMKKYYEAVDDCSGIANEEQCLNMLKEIKDCRETMKRRLGES